MPSDFSPEGKRFRTSAWLQPEHNEERWPRIKTRGARLKQTDLNLITYTHLNKEGVSKHFSSAYSGEQRYTDSLVRKHFKNRMRKSNSQTTDIRQN